MEKLNGVHPDVSVEVITQVLATLKLPIVVKEEVIKYLESRAKTSAASDFAAQIQEITDNGVPVIWDSIRENVAARMFDEFGSLYADNKANTSFVAFMDAGQDLDLGPLPSFQTEVSASADAAVDVSPEAHESAGAGVPCSQSGLGFFPAPPEPAEPSQSDKATETPKPK